MAPRRLFAVLPAALLLAGCGRNDGAVEVAIIDTPEQLFADGLRLSAGAQHLRTGAASSSVCVTATGPTDAR
jgi:hypothetical protein